MTLNKKIKHAQKIIKQAHQQWPSDQQVVAWTGGKDSTVILHLIREIFNQQIPFKVLFNDSTIEFPEIYQFIKQLSNDWQFNLITIKHSPQDLKKYHQAKNKTQQTKIIRLAKIKAITKAVKKHQLKAIFSGIRWDEHPARSQEKYFSLRKNHTRIHPILHFTFKDIWRYIKQKKVPYVSLYDQGYKSLGEAPLTKPVSSQAPERAGRDPGKEKVMARLRQLGYW